MIYYLLLGLPKAITNFLEILLSIIQVMKNGFEDLLRLAGQLIGMPVVNEQIYSSILLLPAIFFITSLAHDPARQSRGTAFGPLLNHQAVFEESHLCIMWQAK